MPTKTTTGPGPAQIDVQADWEEIDPTAAKELLNESQAGRRLSYRVAGQYANDMREGNWFPNGESVKVADNGLLIDGQHRLMGIILSNTTQKMLVVRGLPEQARATVDTGRRRSLAQILEMAGEENAFPLATIGRRVLDWQRGERRRVHNPAQASTQMQVLSFISNHPDLKISAKVAASISRKAGIPTAPVGLAHYVFSHIDAKDADWFFEHLASGTDLSEGHPILALRRASTEQKRTRKRVPEWLWIAYLIKAWNAYRAGESVGFLRYTPGGAKPESFPEPK